MVEVLVFVVLVPCLFWCCGWGDSVLCGVGCVLVGVPGGSDFFSYEVCVLSFLAVAVFCVLEVVGWGWAWVVGLGVVVEVGAGVGCCGWCCGGVVVVGVFGVVWVWGVCWCSGPCGRG